MKVVLITRFFPSNIEPYHLMFIYEQGRELAKKNEVIVINPIERYPSLAKYKNLSHKRSVIPRHRRLNGIHVYSPDLWYLPKLQSRYAHWNLALTVTLSIMRRARDSDLIHVHNAIPDAFAGTVAGRILRKPVVVTCHGSDINIWASPECPRSRSLVIKGLTNADRVIAVSTALKQKIKELGIREDKIRVIGNGYNPAIFFPRDPLECRKKLGIPLDKMIYVSVGMLKPVKGFASLIDAYGKLKRSGIDFAAYIIGEGEDRVKLEAQIKMNRLDNAVFLAGAFPHEQIPYWMSAADYIVVSSVNEGWPCVVVESIACGTPVLATPVGGIPEIITPECGFLSAGIESDALADMILKSISLEYLRSRIVRFAKHFTWETIVEQISDVYEEVLAENRRLSKT